MKILWVLMIIGGFPIFVNAAPTLKSLVETARKMGEDFVFPRRASQLLDLPEGLPARAIDASPEDSVDGRFRSLMVLVSTEAVYSRSFVLMSKKKTATETESFYSKIDLGGEPKTCMMLVAKFGEDGKPIVDSIKSTPLDVSSPEARQRLKTELDFWLKGKGRKKSPAKK